MTDIPTVDLSDPDPDAVGAALGSVGFLLVRGHGVPAPALDAVYRAAAAVMALPETAKTALAPPGGQRFRGLHRDWHQPSGRVVFEQFEVNRFDGAGDAVAAGVDVRYRDYFRPNIWPNIPGFRGAFDDCFTRTQHLGLRVMALFALALRLPADHFAPSLEHGVHNFGVNHYPPQPLGSDRPDRLLVAHGDSGMLTLLHQRGDYAGLQVQRTDGRWMLIEPNEDAFVVNIGSLMSRWTNGAWRATPHRVVPAEDPTSSRTSIVTFLLPAVDAVVVPIVSPGDEARFGPVRTYDWEKVFLEDLARIKHAEGLGALDQA
jgi:isopenicillin N synthase-like dioxygenase